MSNKLKFDAVQSYYGASDNIMAEIKKDKRVHAIYKLITVNRCNSKIHNDLYHNMIALHFAKLNKFSLMKLYFKKAIKLGNTYAMYSMGRYYEYKPDTMKHYYEMGAALGSCKCIMALANYAELNDNKEEMMKYLYLANSYGSNESFVKLKTLKTGLESYISPKTINNIFDKNNSSAINNKSNNDISTNLLVILVVLMFMYVFFNYVVFLINF